MPAMLQKARTLYREKRWFRWAVELGVLALIVTVVGAVQARNHPRGTAPAYVFTTLEQQPVSFASLAGKPTLLTIWAPWCSVCKAESDNVGRAHRWLGEKVNVVSVATAFQDVGQVRAYMQAQGVDYPVLLAGDDFPQVMRVDAFPTLFVLDAQGRIVGSAQGYVTTLGLLWRALWA